jgi:hypothetical protein
METQCYVSQAENKAGARIDANDAQIERAEEFLRMLVLDAVAGGWDMKLRNSYAPNSSGRICPVSEYLGECSAEAQMLLFAACHLASKDGHPNQVAERNAAAAHMLRNFVKRVADDYAELRAAEFVGGEA